MDPSPDSECPVSCFVAMVSEIVQFKANEIFFKGIPPSRAFYLRHAKS
jgi:hypothetical protein